MAEGAYIFGWDEENTCWVKILVNPEGKLIIDPTEIFEDPPTEDEHGKAPASSWAFDHEADPDAHHEEYTDVKARGAINDILDNLGRLTGNFNAKFKTIQNLQRFIMKTSADSAYLTQYYSPIAGYAMRLVASQSGVGFINTEIGLYRTDHYVYVIHEDNLLSKYSDLKGSQYLAIPGVSFIGQQSFSDDIDYSVTSGAVVCNVNNCALMAQVNLPEGATVTGVIVRGNAGAEAETFELRRVKLLDATNSQMATQNIGTEDITISDPVIDNANYAYFIVTSTLDTGDSIYGAIIVYTL